MNKVLLLFFFFTKLLRNYWGKHTDLSAKPSSWPYAKVLFYYNLTKSFILGSTLKLLVNSNLRFLSCFYVQWRLFLRIMALIGLRCIPSLWCAVRHRCHTCWSHRDTLQCQTRSWSHSCYSHFRCFQWNQFLPLRLCSRYQLRWILPCYSWSLTRPETQWASSTCYGPVK